MSVQESSDRRPFPRQIAISDQLNFLTKLIVFENRHIKKIGQAGTWTKLVSEEFHLSRIVVNVQ